MRTVLLVLSLLIGASAGCADRAESPGARRVDVIPGVGALEVNDAALLVKHGGPQQAATQLRFGSIACAQAELRQGQGFEVAYADRVIGYQILAIEGRSVTLKQTEMLDRTAKGEGIAVRETLISVAEYKPRLETYGPPAGAAP